MQYNTRAIVYVVGVGVVRVHLWQSNSSVLSRTFT
jgi:hypothetical protein